MALVTRNVNNTGSPLYGPSGVLLANTTITFTLVDFNDTPTGAFDATTGDHVIGSVSVVTNASGEFSVGLWPNTRGDRTTKYVCAIKHPNAEVFVSIVPAGASPLSWLDFKLAGAVLTPIQVTALDAHIADLTAHGGASITSVFGRTGAVVAVEGDYTSKTVAYPADLRIGTPTHVTTIQNLLDHTVSAGVVDGAALTDNGNGTIGLAVGNAMLRSADDPHSPLYSVLLPATASLALTDDSINYVYYSYNGGTPIAVASASSAAFNGTDKVVAWVVHRLGNVLHSLDARGFNVDSARKTAHMSLDTERFRVASGGSVLGSTTGLSVSVTAGHFYFLLGEISHVAFDTSVAGTANANVFELWTVAAGVWTGTPNTKLVNSTLYNSVATGPVTLGNNKAGVVWFYVVNNAPSELHAVMGQSEYANLAAARAATPPSSVPSIISGLGVLIGFVVFEKSATTFADIRSAFAVQFTSATATSHEGLAGLLGGLPNDHYHQTAAQQAATEYTTNKSTSVVADQASDTKYPSVKSVYDWVVAGFAALGGSVGQLFKASNFVPGFTTTVTSATPITLTVSSTHFQDLTGTAAQTIVLPVVSTLTTGHSFYFDNDSTATATVNSSGGNLVLSIPAGSFALIVCVLNTGTTAASWSSRIAAKINGDTTQAFSASGVTTSGTGTGVTISNSNSTAALQESIAGTMTFNTAVINALSLTTGMTGGASTTAARGIFINQTYTPTANATIQSVLNNVTLNSGVSPSAVQGINTTLNLGALALGGTISAGYGELVSFSPNASATTNITNWYSFSTTNIANGTAQTVNTAFGFYSGMNSVGGSTRWGFHAAGTADNAFNGNCRFGGVTAPTVAVDVTGAIAATTTIKTGGYTVATLPAGTTGTRAYVTDATAPTWLGALTGGGAVVCPVFKNATVWVSA